MSARNSTFGREMERDIDIIDGYINSEEYVWLECGSFLVGTHERVWTPPHNKSEFTVKICKHGLRFTMPHIKTPSKRLHLTVPKHATRGVTAHVDSEKLSCLILTVGNGMASYIRELLGMKPEDRRVWFDPMSQNPGENNILFRVDEFGDECIEFIKELYKENITVLDQKTTVLQTKIKKEDPEYLHLVPKHEIYSLSSIKPEQVKKE